jgi:riboflavin kinase/FMN adenylyltransferase
MFDGVHRGHQFVLRQVCEMARERGLQSMAITFNHPVSGRPVLTPLEVRTVLLSMQGLDKVEVLTFDDRLRTLTARQFMEQVLRDTLHVRVLLVGYDNRFGHNRAEGFDDYVRYGRELGIDVVGLPPLEEGSVSSTHIRNLLLEGRADEAAQALGFPYTIVGRVEHGEHVGTTLGFPTANVVPDDPSQLIPAPGAYAVKVRQEGHVELKHGMMNIGRRPTFDGHRQTLEVHIFRLAEDLYGQRLYVSLVSRLRDERCFDDAEALKVQLQHDAEEAERLLTPENDD